MLSFVFRKKKKKEQADTHHPLPPTSSTVPNKSIRAVRDGDAAENKSPIGFISSVDAPFKRLEELPFIMEDSIFCWTLHVKRRFIL